MEFKFSVVESIQYLKKGKNTDALLEDEVRMVTLMGVNYGEQVTGHIASRVLGSELLI